MSNATGHFAVVGVAAGGGTKTAPLTFAPSIPMENSIGKTHWAIAEGYIPPDDTDRSPALTSHETACLLNTSDQEARVQITLYFSDREPVGPYHIQVPARRTKHVRFNDLQDPEPVPRGTDYASLLVSDVPIVVQHTRLDSRQVETALLSTIAYAG